jgi:hypothetical protein
MAEKPVKFETQEVKALRGFEAKTIEKYELDGWELISQEKGKLRTTFNFRRPKKPIPMNLILGGAALTLIVVAGITFGSLSENSDTSNENAETQVTQEAESEKTPTVEPTPELEPNLTVDNNKDLARLLADKRGDTAFWQTFFDKYEGRTLEFDANVGYLELHKDYEYTYDALILAEDFDENSQVGPPFRVEAIVGSYGWHKTNPDDFITIGTNIRIVAELYDYNNRGETFELKIVSTTVR